jgi:hypothetical protein
MALCVDDPAMGPLRMIFPNDVDRAAWWCGRRSAAADTREEVFHYQHQHIGRWLRLDARARVYGEDAEGTVRLFGRGGAMALAVALNAVYDGMDAYRPSQIVIPQQSDRRSALAAPSR